MCPIKPVVIYDGHSSSNGEEVVLAPFGEVNEDDILDDLEDLWEDYEENFEDDFVENVEENLEEVGAEGDAVDGAEGGAEGGADFGGLLSIVPPNLRGIVRSVANAVAADFIVDFAAGRGFRELVERDPDNHLR